MYGIFGALCDQVDGVKVDQEPSFPIFNALGKDIVSEKAKIGGDWVIAGFIPTRLMRDVIRKACNINATFINLIIDSELRQACYAGSVKNTISCHELNLLSPGKWPMKQKL